MYKYNIIGILYYNIISCFIIDGRSGVEVKRSTSCAGTV